MIYYMSTKTLMKEFIKDHSPDKVLDCEFISFSTRVIPFKHMKKISFSRQALFGLDSVEGLSSFQKKSVEDRNISIVKKSLIESDLDIHILNNIIIENLVFPEKMFVLLSSPNEYKTGYPYYLSKAIYELYNFPVIDYTKDKHKDFSYNPKEVLKRVDFYKARVIMRTSNKEKILALSRKEKKSILKSALLWEKGMDDDEMDEMITKDIETLPFRL